MKKIEKYAPICLFTYNRLEETKKTVEALQLNNLASKSNLYIFSDGWKNADAKSKIKKVRSFLRTISGFNKVTIFESSTNKGLANSIIDGVSKIVNIYGKVIVLEDDLLTTTNFLDFMNQALEYYNNDLKIQSISGFSLKIKSKNLYSDVYFHERAHSWSWATWSDRWDIDIFDKVKLEKEVSSSDLKGFKKKCGDDIPEMLINSIKGINDSWYVRWAYSQFSKGKYTVYPYLSKVKNIGFSTEGTNCNGIDVSVSEEDTCKSIDFKFVELSIEDRISKEFLNYFSIKYKLKYRLMLLKSRKGISSLLSEIKRKFKDGY